MLKTSLLSGTLRPLKINREAKIRISEISKNVYMNHNSSMNKSAMDVQTLPSSVNHQQISESKGNLTPQTVDDFILQKLGNMVVWLRSLAPIRNKPDLANELERFCNPLALGFYKEWFKKDIFYFMDKKESVIDGLLVSHGLKPNEFKIEELDKFWRYMESFADAIRKELKINL